MLVTFLDMDEELAGEVLLEGFRSEISREGVEALADLSLKYSVLGELVDIESFLP